MSGHSKWSKIQHKKGKVDAARGNLFTKLTSAIAMATQQGGSDPNMNFNLRLAIEKAKSCNVPKENIERAIKRGAGDLKDNSLIEEILYEGFGSNGVTFLIEAVTDNKNRTVSEIKHVFSRYGGSLGGPGSVKWQFEHRGVVTINNEYFLSKTDQSKIGISASVNKDDFELALMDAGVEDISEKDGVVELKCEINDLQKVLEKIQEFGIKPDNFGLEWLAKEPVKINEETNDKVEAIYESLYELDDVREVYSNCE